MTKVKEPLILSAPLARQIAPSLCRKDPISGEDCSWYHGLWQDLRLMGLAATPEHQADFFSRAFEIFSHQNKRLRLLISGAADYSILAHVIWACEAHHLHADITILDACDTPLFLNNWYADKVGHEIDTVRADIFDYHTSVPFDVICGHSFLGQFPPIKRSELVQKWQQILTPGGSLVNINRIRPDTTPHKVNFSPGQADAFREKVKNKTAGLPVELRPDPQEFAQRIESYIRRLHVYPLSADDLMALFKGENFRIDHFSRIASCHGTDRSLSGLAIPENAEHACIIATKTS